MEQVQNHNSERYISIREFAERLSLSKWTAYAWVSEGRIKSIKIGRLVRIPEAELERIIQEGEREVLR